MDASKSEKIFEALDRFRIELPSWGFANTGTRFGKFIQPAAATTTEEKFSDAGQVHLLTGVCPTIALHVLWDCKEGVQSTDEIKQLAHRHGVLPGLDQSQSVSGPGLQIRIIRQSGPGHSPACVGAHKGQHRDCPAAEQQRRFHVVCGRLQLSGDSEYSAAQAVVHGNS